MPKPIKAKIDFTLNNTFYKAGDEVNANFNQIAKLNELGYIEPLTRIELEELKNPKKEVK